MKRNIVLTIAYDGTRYRGWQKQGNTKNTLQEKLETLLSGLLSENIEINGAGRTDAGVHAKGQVVNFITDSTMPLEKMLDEANRYLPDDIAVVDIKEAAGRFHSRLNAVGKHYRYTILNSKIKDVFAKKYVSVIEEPLDIEAMKEASEYLIGEHDFAAFCGNKKMKKSTVRKIEKIDFTIDENKIIIDFYGNGFLQYMIRIITGTLIEIGLHKRKAAEMKEILKSGDRANAGGVAEAKGLCLVKVFY